MATKRQPRVKAPEPIDCNPPSGSVRVWTDQNGGWTPPVAAERFAALWRRGTCQYDLAVIDFDGRWIDDLPRTNAGVWWLGTFRLATDGPTYRLSCCRNGWWTVYRLNREGK